MKEENQTKNDLIKEKEIINNKYSKLETEYNDLKATNEKSILDLKKFKEKTEELINKKKEEKKQLELNIKNISKEKQDIEKKYNEANNIITEYKKEINSSKLKMNQLIEEQKKKYEQQILLLKTNHEKEMSEKEKHFKENEKELNEYKRQKEQLEKINKEYLTQKESSICKTIHNGIKCQKCFRNPIVGYRYKCSECQNYNLCQDCEELNSINVVHPHNFIKIRNELNENYNNGNYINDNNNIIQYSYNILTTKLYTYIHEGTNEAKIFVPLKNDGLNKWPENATKLIVDKKCSLLICNDINLKPLNPGDQDTYEIHFNGLKDFTPNEYTTILYFNANGKNYGNKISLSVFIKPKQINPKEMVEQFKKKYNLYDKFSDDIIYSYLSENKFEFEPTFFKLYFS